VNGNVRLGQHHAARGAAAVELMEEVSQDRETGLLDRVEAETAERCPVT
jgi:hypothetical protein